MNYSKKYTLPNGDTLTVTCNPHSYGGEEGMFEVIWRINGWLGEPLGWLTFQQVAEILANHGWE
jgi:hypothetical protein